VDSRGNSAACCSAVMISRLLAVLAATLLVTAFSLFMLTPYDLSLAQGVTAMDPAMLRHLQSAVRHTIGAGSWTYLAVPVLARPVWLLPFCAGLICAGLANTFTASPDASERSRKRS